MIQNGEVKIVHEFTGRILEGRRWSEGLHQAVGAKERVRIKHENQTLATITLQTIFRKRQQDGGDDLGYRGDPGGRVRPHLRPGGGADPTHRAMVRVDHPDLIYKSEEAKFNVVVQRHRRALRVGPAGVGRHGVGGEKSSAGCSTKPACATRSSTPSTSGKR